MQGTRSTAASILAEGAEAAQAEVVQEEEAVVFNEPPDDETTLMFYLLIRRRPREVFLGSGLFIGYDLADAKRHVVETVFGVGLPCTDDELLERYNVDVVEFDDDWEKKLNDLANPPCPTLL